MPPENQNKAKDVKQKITLVLVIIVVAIVIWQVVGMFGGGGAAESTPAPAQTQTKTVATNGNTQPVNNSPSPVASSESQTPKQVPVQANAEILRVQQESQAKYIAALNELEMLKVQKDIAETKQAITNSTLATATAEKSITDLLTVQQTPQGGGNINGGNQYSPFAATAVQPEPPSQQNNPNTMMPPAPAPAKTMDTNYSVVSITFKADKWNAILTYKNDMYDVNIGDVLEPDGSVVASIDRNGVVLRKDKISRKITMTSAL